MLRILMGKAKSGKTYRVYEEIKKAIEIGCFDKIILLVPEQFTLETEKELLKHIQKEGLLGVEILSFKRLIYKLLNEVEMPPYQEITTLGRAMLLRKVFKQTGANLNYYKAASQKKGFLNQFNDFLDEMKHSLVDVNTIQRAVSDLDETSLLSMKLKDLSLLMAAYEAAKTERYMDSVDVIEFALDRMAQSVKIRGAQVWVDGFDSFSKVEYQILDHLMRLSKHLTLTIPFGENRVFTHIANLHRQVLEISNQNQVESVQFLMNHDNINPLITHLSENILNYPYARHLADQNRIKLHSGNSITDEVEHAVIEIINLVRDQNYDWKDIAVVTNALSGYEFIIKQVFTEYKIPFFMDQKMDILSHPLVHLVINSLKTIQSRFKREYVMSMLKTGLLDFSVSEISLFENYIIEFGISGRQYIAPFTKNFKGSRCYDLEKVNAIREKLLEKLHPLLGVHSSKEIEVKKLLTQVYEFLVLNEVALKMDQEVNKFKESMA